MIIHAVNKKERRNNDLEKQSPSVCCCIKRCNLNVISRLFLVEIHYYLLVLKKTLLTFRSENKKHILREIVKI